MTQRNDLGIALPIIPSQVDLEDLDERGFLRTEDEAKEIKEALSEKENAVYEDQRARRIHKNGNTLEAIYNKKPIGKGNFGTLFLKQNIDTGTWRAVKKVIPKNEAECSQFKNEAIIWEKLQLIERNSKPATDIQPEESKSDSFSKITQELESNQTTDLIEESKHNQPYFISMPYFDGMSVNDFVKSRTLSKDELLKLFQNMLKATQYFFNKGFIHRDIKPDNFIVNPDTLEVHLIDYNVSASRGNKKYINDRTLVGSPAYRSSIIETTFSKKENESAASFTYNETSECHSLVASFSEILKLPQYDMHRKDFSSLLQKEAIVSGGCDIDIYTNANTFQEIEDELTSIRNKTLLSVPKYAFIHAENVEAILKNESALEQLKTYDEVFLISEQAFTKNEESKELEHKEQTQPQNTKTIAPFELSKMVHKLRAENVKIQFQSFANKENINTYLKNRMGDTKFYLENDLMKKINELIDAENRRLTAENKKNKNLKREERINKLTFFKTKDIKTLDKLVEELETLKKDTRAITGIKSWRISTFFGLDNSKTTDRINKLIKEIKKEKKREPSNKPTDVICQQPFGGFRV